MFKCLLLILGMFCWVGAQELPVDGVENDDGMITVEQFIASLQKQKGTVELPGGIATLNLPKNMHYYAPEESKKILEDLWGNPPSELGFGMIFPDKYSPSDADAWAITIDYVEDGYVSDDDAESIDYSDVLEDMQDAESEINEERARAGYESIHLVGWAAQPHYNKDDNTLHWAKELQFGNEPTNTLNYNIRVLGRKGYLLLNFISTIDKLPEIRASMGEVLPAASFNDGYKYAQFDESSDNVAAYGIGALVAGNVAAKLGIFAKILFALKKFWILGAILIGGIVKKFWGEERRRQSVEDESEISESDSKL